MKKGLLCVMSVMLVLSVVVMVSAAAPAVTVKAEKTQITAGENVSAVVSVSGVKAASAYVSVAAPEGLQIVSGKWLKKGILKDFGETDGTIMFGSAIAVEGELIELVFKGVKDLNAVQNVEITVQFKDGTQLVLDKTVSTGIRVICTSHTYGQWETTVEATCEAAGVEAQTCLYCTAKKERPAAALGHNVVDVPAVAPTCTETGLTAGTACERCQKVGVAQTEVPALGHDEISHDAKAPTCTEIGWDAYVTCSRCDYTTYQELARTEHSMKEVPAVPSTCTKPGLLAGTACEYCHAVGVAQIVVPPFGHRFSEETCIICGAPENASGDLDSNGNVNEDDAIYLLQHVMMPDLFAVPQPVDFNGDGKVNEDDAIYLLQHVMMPELFPLN